MNNRVVMIRNILWFYFLFTTAFTFYLQVIFSSHWMALVPYAFAGCLFILKPAYYFRELGKLYKNVSFSLQWFVLAYACFLLIKAIISLYYGLSIQQIFRDIFLYLFPVSTYYLVVFEDDENCFKYAFLAIVSASILSGAYYFYESFFKAIFHLPTEFAEQAFYYAFMRSGAESIEDINRLRVGWESRASGLMMLHSHSATWVAIGAYAINALPNKWEWTKYISAFALFIFISNLTFIVFGGMVYPVYYLLIACLIIVAYILFQTDTLIKHMKWYALTISFLLLMLVVNFTAIVSFVMVFILIFLKDIKFKFRKMSLNSYSIGCSICSLLMIGLLYWQTGHPLFEKMVYFLKYNIGFIFFPTESMEYSYISLTLHNVSQYFVKIAGSPYLLFMGEINGVSVSYRGGDTGFIESILVIGLPFYSSFIIYILFLLWKYRGQKNNEIYEINICRQNGFALPSLLFIALMEAHYSVWIDKSLAIILFLSLAIISRNRTVIE